MPSDVPTPSAPPSLRRGRSLRSHSAQPQDDPGRALRLAGWSLLILVLIGAIGYFVLRQSLHTAMTKALPQLDGTIALPHAGPPLFGLHAPVTVRRDARGVPHIQASSMDDLLFAQGYVTAQDRLWQMDLLRRHAAGELAAILGRSLIEHDRLQRTLGILDAADRAFTALPADQKHSLEVYASGVNTFLAMNRDHLPLEFRVLQYTPGPWSPRDSLLLGIVMYQDLSTGFPTKLGRESLAAHLPPELMADLYPTGSWRDHWPGKAQPDLTAVQPAFEEIPLDSSQTRLRRPARPLAGPSARSAPQAALDALNRTLALFHAPCPDCVAGSNGWAIAGSRSASGKPLLSNDMHLSLTVPGLWYEVDLQAPNAPPLAPFHVAGLSIPGVPFVIAGHNDHVAWGFTNLGADVQDLYIEHTRGTPSGAQYQAADGSWQPVRYRREIIRVRGGPDVTLDVPLTRHGDTETPLISSIMPGETRSISLRWTVYDPANVGDPFEAVDAASDWASMMMAMASFGGPSLNMMYADDQGHIGYHAVGRIPIRGSAATPTPLAPVPTDTAGPDAASHEWAGYIPFDQLPQSFDPPDGVVATANGRVTPEGYTLPIALDWMAPYRTERIYKLLETEPGRPTEVRRNLRPQDMLAIQTDVYSGLDLIYAEKLAYAIDHTAGPFKNDPVLHQAADMLRNWNGEVVPQDCAPAIIQATRNAFWPLLLIPHLAPQLAPAMRKGTAIPGNTPPDVARNAQLWKAYVWGEKPFVEEQMLMYQPARWLPAGYKNWDDFLAAVVSIALKQAKAPHDLSRWSEGKAFPLELEHPIFSRSPWLQYLIGKPTGPGTVPQRGDLTTIVQVDRTFGPSERMTVDLANPDQTTLNVVLGESGNVSSPYYMDQFQAWLKGTTYPLTFSSGATAATHTLTLRPQ